MGIVTLTQYVHPNGRQKKIETELPDDVCVMADEMVLSCECAPADYGKIIVYARPKGESEEDEDVEIATNGPGANSPNVVLEAMIKRIHRKKNGEGEVPS
ncbi:MAG: hypothetical protein IMZ71_02615 [Chloroflexi bacterium]|nr:hypothetical protein [Chloroflexota bacterium]